MATKWDTSKLAKGLAKGHKLVSHLDRAIGDGERVWSFSYEPKIHDDAWHPSGDCTPSLLELYEKATGEVKPRSISTSLAKTFMVGHFWHQWLQFLVVDLGLAEESAIEIKGRKGWGDYSVDLITNPKPQNYHYSPFHWVTGSADICPYKTKRHGDYVVDFKTMADDDFKLTGLPGRFAAKYECQLNIYMDLFEMDQAIIVAIQKGSPHEMKEFTFRRNQPLIDAIYDKWHIVSGCLDEGVTPPADEDIKLPLKGVVV